MSTEYLPMQRVLLVTYSICRAWVAATTSSRERTTTIYVCDVFLEKNERCFTIRRVRRQRRMKYSSNKRIHLTPLALLGLERACLNTYFVSDIYFASMHCSSTGFCRARALFPIGCRMTDATVFC